MPIPTVVDLAAERLWSQVPNHVIKKMVLLQLFPVDIWSERGAMSSKMRGEGATIKDVALLAQSQYPGQPSPALDAIWAAKGDRATVDDFRAYWEGERLGEAEARRAAGQ